jgi:hypothetical protein
MVECSDLSFFFLVGYIYFFSALLLTANGLLGGDKIQNGCHFMNSIQVESLVFVVLVLVSGGRHLDAFNNNAMCNLTLSETKKLLPILILDDGQDKT